MYTYIKVTITTFANTLLVIRCYIVILMKKINILLIICITLFAFVARVVVIRVYRSILIPAKLCCN